MPRRLPLSMGQENKYPALVNQLVDMGFPRRAALAAAHAAKGDQERAFSLIVNYQEKNRHDIDYENFRPEGGSEPTQQRSQQQQQGPQSDIEKALQMSLQAVQPQQSQADDGDAELQRVLELSKQHQGPPSVVDLTNEPGGLSGEDAQLQQALLTSIQGSDQNTLSSVSSDPVSRQRLPGAFVGLKNVGNTCYLNSLLQAYFMMPQVRQEVLSAEVDTATDPKDPNAVFLSSLQSLFGHLILSDEKFYDPSTFFKSIMDEAGNPVRIGSQEDVSEFNDLFIHRISKAMELKKGPTGSSVSTTAVGTNAGSSDNNEKDESTEDMDSSDPHHPSAVPVESTSEVMPVELPGTIHAQIPDKSNQSFLEKMLHADAVETAMTRLENGTVSEQQKNFDFGRHFILPVGKSIKDLYMSLDSFMNDVVAYTSDEGMKGEKVMWKWFTQLPNLLMLQQNRVQFESGSQRKVNDAVKFDEILYMDRYMLKNKQVSTERRGFVDGLRAQLTKLEEELSVRQSFKGSNTSVDFLLDGTMTYLEHRRDTYPGEDVSQLESIYSTLKKFYQQETTEMARLKTEISELQSKIDATFDDLKEHPYRLFAVWVHAGVAGSGHYWAYIRDLKTGKWQKFNDIFVSEVDQDVVFADAIGGSGNTSAYFLIYMNEQEYQRASELAQQESPSTLVPTALQTSIAAENAKFQAQLEEFTKNSDDKKVERFITEFNNKMKGAQETGRNFTTSKDMRVRTFFAFLESIGMHDEMTSAVIKQCWMQHCGRGIDKDLDTPAFNLAMAKLPEGETLLRRAVDSAMNPEAETKLTEQHKLFQMTFQYIAAGINFSNERKYSDSIRNFCMAIRSNEKLEFDNAKRRDIVPMLRIVLLAAFDEVANTIGSPTSTALFDDIVSAVTALFNEDDSLVIALRDRVFSELLGTEANSDVLQRLTDISERLLEAVKTELKWNLPSPKPYEELRDWENLVIKTRDSLVRFWKDNEVYIESVQQLYPDWVPEVPTSNDPPKQTQPEQALVARPAAPDAMDVDIA